MNKYTIEKYQLQDVKNIKIIEEKIENKNIELLCESISKNNNCPCCNCKTKYHYDTKIKTSRIRHINYTNMKVFLNIKKKRYKCLQCNKVFTEIITGIEKNKRKTENFVFECLDLLKDISFKKTQDKKEVSYSFLLNSLEGFVGTEPKDINWKKEFENEDFITIGIDEHGHKKRKFAMTIVNITKHKVITILKDYTQKELEIFLMQIPSEYRKKIRYVAIDFTNRYRKVIKKWLKNAEIVVDYFHLIGIANRLLWSEKRVIEGVLREEKVKYFKLLLKAKENLTEDEILKVNKLLLVKKHDGLKIAYELKEEIRSLLNKDNTDSNSNIINKFLQITDRDFWNKNNYDRKLMLKYSKYYRTFIETLKINKKEIINFINTRITNAMTEGFHTKIKLIKRISYGMRNINNYIKKVMLTFMDIKLFSFHTN